MFGYAGGKDAPRILQKENPKERIAYANSVGGKNKINKIRKYIGLYKKKFFFKTVLGL